ncbi:SNARE associated golgi protein [Nitzschia inconspicua]|uniref:SNARE associated golgi protein n=1 Tax=Nitzschia inconspicua TaxID=303405 RepID=A0A9K3KZ72_9STRA|nr:SNARE associated golgi protein [Nitzschia inconspicua]
MNRRIASLFCGKKTSSTKVPKRNQKEECISQNEGAETLSRSINSVFVADAAVVSSSSSSWSSNPPEVPYASAGGTETSMITRAQQLASQTPYQQSQHWMPAPQYLAAQSSIKNLDVSPHLQSINDGESRSLSDEDFPCATFPVDAITNRKLAASAATSTAMKNATSFSNGPQILRRKKTRFQEFSEELSGLVNDLMDYSKAKTWKKKVMAVALCLSSVLVFYDLIFGKYIVQWLHDFILWMSTHSIEAVFAFIGIFVVATLIFIPPTLLIFGAGYAFTVALDSVWMGILASVLSCFMGSCIGATIAFLRARYMMRDLIELFSKRYPLVRAADRALTINGFRIMLLLRLCPILPFNGLNYICGITGVSLHDFTFSLIGVLPFHIYTTVVGATAGVLRLDQLRNPNNAEHTRLQHISFIVLIATGVFFGLIAMVYTWRLVKIELKRELELTSEEFEELIHPPQSKHPDMADIDSDGFYIEATESDDERATASSIETKYMEDGEEWYWVWV